VIGTFATVAVVGAVCSESFIEGDLTVKTAKAKGMSQDEPSHVLWRTAGLPLALGIVAFCFSGHAIIPSIYSTMKYPQDFDQMITAIYPVVVGCSFAVALSGYYMFGFAVEDQITLSLAEGSSSPFVMKCLTWLMILTAFSKLSLNMYPISKGMEEMCSPYIATEQGLLAASCTIKVIITFFALLVAILVPSFSLLCAFVGLICTVCKFSNSFVSSRLLSIP
jgi:vesicular inhibitory amino acid transporter